jgi:hypothetical protein
MKVLRAMTDDAIEVEIDEEANGNIGIIFLVFCAILLIGVLVL